MRRKDYTPWYVNIGDYNICHRFRGFRYRWQAVLFARHLQRFTTWRVWILKPISEETAQELIKRLQALRVHLQIENIYLRQMSERLRQYNVEEAIDEQ